MKICFVIHSQIRGATKLRRSIAAVFEKEFAVAYAYTAPKGGAFEPVLEAIEAGMDYVIVVGGDGSINEAINAYMSATASQRKAVVLGVLPYGTGNDFAKSIYVSAEVRQLHRLIQQADILEVDLCRMTFLDLNHQSSERYFINVADIGLGGYVAQHLVKRSGGWGSRWMYFKATLLALVRYKKQWAQVKSEQYAWEGEAMSICMANGRYFGSGLCIAPKARLDDGQIQLSVFGAVGLWDYLKNIADIRKGKVLTHPGVTYATVRSLSINTNDVAIPIDMDGEFVGHTPLSVEVVPKGVKIIGRISADES